MTAADRADRVERYRLRLLEANSESARRELFKGLLQSLFGHDPGAAWVLDEMSLGAETVLKVPLPDRLKTGYADTQYGTVIIEYKQDLAKEGAAAEEQLAGYVLGNWHAGQAFRFTPIATDGAAWRVLTPRYEQLAAGPADPASLEMRVKDEFTLDGDADPEAFYLFLDRHLFGTEPVPPTLERIEREFGETGAVFITALTALRARFDACAADDELGPELAVAEEQWRRFLSIAYGTFDPGPDVFLVHTYLSVVAKLLAYEVLTGDDHIDDGELRGILTGEIFERLNVRGFTDKDFFAWVAEDAHLPRLRPAFREVAAAVGRFDFSNVSEDILKGVYQELIDLDTRHALGEYYTPDWLCERVLAEFEPAADARVLDPACGSGSFLRAAVARLRELHPDLPPDALARQVVGIDIHPLSVQIAKATVLTALGPAARKLKSPIELRVYLANTLRTPEGSVGELFGGSVKMAVDDRVLTLPKAVTNSQEVWDAGVAAADRLAHTNRGKPDGVAADERAALAAHVRRRTGLALNDDAADAFHRVYRAFKAAVENHRDGIWRFIVQNVIRPAFLKGKFDLVVGNPPWLTYSDVAVADYQSELSALAKDRHVLPARANNRTHLEIATIFQSYCASAFLKPRKEGGGRTAFVMPRSFFSADHHAETRDGRARGFKLTQLWDLDGVTPLFRVPACVLFGSNARPTDTRPQRAPNKSGTPGYAVTGKLRGHNQTWEQAGDRLTFEPATWYVGALGKRTAFTRRRPGKSAGGENPYKSEFRQGATIVPRNAYFVRPAQAVDDLDDRELVVETDPVQAKQAKAPWKGTTFRGRVHSDFLYRTALSNSLLPFALYDPALVLLPAARDAPAAGGGGDFAASVARRPASRRALRDGGVVRRR